MFCSPCPHCIALVLRTEQPWQDPCKVGWNLHVLVTWQALTFSISLLDWRWDQCRCVTTNILGSKQTTAPLVLWQILQAELKRYRWALRLWSEALFSWKEIWKKLDMLNKGTGWWHGIVTSCNTVFVEMISWKCS